MADIEVITGRGRSRAAAMNEGARLGKYRYLWGLHVDCEMTEEQ